MERREHIQAGYVAFSGVVFTEAQAQAYNQIHVLSLASVVNPGYLRCKPNPRRLYVKTRKSCRSTFYSLGCYPF